MSLDNNTLAFFELVRAGLWEREARLSQYNNIDYAAIMQLAEEQSVVGLVTAGLEHVKDVKVPQEWLLQFIGSTLQVEQQNKNMNGFLVRLIEKLRAYGVYAILVKGQGIAHCYERPLWRNCGDIDLLLSSENYEKAKKVLMPLATDVETEYTHFKHLGMTIEDWVVELHGTMHSRLSRRVDRVIDEAQKDVFFAGNVRSEEFKDSRASLQSKATEPSASVQVFLPSPDNDVIFVFTHILRHFFFEGIGLRQICDWCRLLWTYRESQNYGLLESRIRKAGLMSEWRVFAAFAVDWLGMPVEAMPLYSANKRWSKKADKICADVLKAGNFGHKQRRHFGDVPYLLRKIFSSCGRLGDMLRHFPVFPKDSVVFFGGVIRTGLHAVVRGQ